MASNRRKNLVPSRRRMEDEGDEEEGSLAGEVDDDSLSEGSAISNADDDADAEGSDVSEDDGLASPADSRRNGHVNGHAKEAKKVQSEPAEPKAKGISTATTDTEAMMNGIKIPEAASGVSEIHFDDMGEGLDDSAPAASATQPKGQTRETPAERKRREHEEYLKERDQNPAFVPTRGGFFLHDNRSAAPGANGYRLSNRGKPKGRGGVPEAPSVGRIPPRPEPADGQWAHDLHDTVTQSEAPAPKPIQNNNQNPSLNAPRPIPTAPRSSPPNRSFSSRILIGNVTVHVYLPGMSHPIPFSNVSKRQHTCLPQHRPPLRRDKPVRISLPSQPPRYIFPATERSFIFIPRALRPNQQHFQRGRGRGSFYGSRRTSVYGGSNYSPSIAMSRRSSIGGAASRDGVHSPAGSVLSRAPVPPTEPGKPVVRLPPPSRQALGVTGPPPVVFPNGTAVSGAVPPSSFPPPQKPTFRENRPTHIPMHQPRPQKAVSVADIESPASFTFNPPQQQQEQPFHQQVPRQVNGHNYTQDPSMYNPHSRHPSHPSQPSGTPLSQIPGRAIHAQPFQPYPFPQPQAFYPNAYPSGPVFYPPSSGEYPAYSPAMAPSATAPTFVPGSQQIPYVVPVPPPSSDQSGQTGTVAHESNGMVYYFDSSQLYTGNNSTYPAPGYAIPPGGVVGMGGMMTPHGNFYYPQAQGGVFYAPQ